MPLRRCLTDGCNQLTSGTRCATHTRALDRARGTRTERGYGHHHQQARKQLLKLLPIQCGYGCGTWLTTPQDLIAAHRIDGNPNAGYLASCRTCNEQAKTRNQHP